MTVEPRENAAEHPVVAAVPPVIVQLIPDGTDVTTPVPFPLPITVSVPPDSVKIATTEVACATVNTQLPAPLQPPDQPVNVLPATAAAVNVTVEF